MAFNSFKKCCHIVLSVALCFIYAIKPMIMARFRFLSQKKQQILIWELFTGTTCIKSPVVLFINVVQSAVEILQYYHSCLLQYHWCAVRVLGDSNFWVCI